MVNKVWLDSSDDFVEDLVMDGMVDARVSPCSGVAADDSGGKEDIVPANQGLGREVPM